MNRITQNREQLRFIDTAGGGVAKDNFNFELNEAQRFVESFSASGGAITMDITSGGIVEDVTYIKKEKDKNWFYAVAGYQQWGKGKACISGDDFTLQFEYKLFDQYNWDGGKSVTFGAGWVPNKVRDYVLNLFPETDADGSRNLLDYNSSTNEFKVYDRLLGQFHLEGLAKEYEIHSSVKKTVKWKRGDAFPEIKDGWGGRGGR